ncbi:Transglutaminase-like superfamily protein [Methanosarcina thermophila]|uniref:Transglutaminase-like superfamily protein n=3 Tax=Methanosarcina thermophila TaxID=2210 RepID=A0A1I7B472_METTE|nr:transglutaminase-like domain-containing protein [Methanosarcina thermophila]AKB14203.1 hypothetical protein MSTHT_2445 [Methanosarcina thermophila TM-1]AKB15155.1 hypothetical protein MSTHC_0837 [Methanosarcina thermophila CHTI-55]SFT81948.1 Transglutaminase-like superfamily protein [Methanosarcina thermophila]BAW29251.1 conserved hypothetical protein [Methanosarcina thermophila]GLI13689.1 hypothetical protein MTHERMMSTA1_08150 [Methanosarcina thermophila MST-A1]
MTKIKSLNPLSLSLFLLLLYGFTAGCIDSADNGENSVSDSVPETPVTDIKDLIPDRMNTFLTDEEGSGERNSVDRNKSALNSEGSVSSDIPNVPTYPEEKSDIVYPREYRRLSLNFQRGIGSEDERIASEVFNITGKTSGYNIKDACDIFDYVNRHWKYRYDGNAEFFFGAAQTINEGYVGDCDDYSIVISALLRNMGFNTRVVTSINGSYGHAYPELYIGNDTETAYEILGYVKGRYSYAESIWYSIRELEGGELQYWLNFDWSGSNGYMHPGGKYFEGSQVIYYPNGLIEF